ncbi:MAG TPA: hypothetical protein VFE03_00865, partial [Caulobacteraceae bacterium]|nr:hypothetical protein [Caulobacteraceae bacterium]
MLSRREVIGAAALAAFPGVAMAEHTPVVIPLQRRGDSIWVEATINGIGPLRVVVGHLSDAGVVSPELVARCRLHELGDVIVGPGDKDTKLYRAEVLSLAGALDIRKANFVALPNDQGWPDASCTLNHMHGSFGYDFEKNTLTYLRDRPSLTGYESLEIGLRGQDRLRPDSNARVVVLLDGEPASLDVGPESSPGIVLHGAYVKERGLWDWGGRRLPGTDQNLVGKRTQSRTIRMKSLEVGRTTIDGPVVKLGEPRDRERAYPVDGCIGFEVARRFGLWICRDPTIIAVRPNAHVSEPFNYDRSGFDVIAEHGVRRVASLLPGGPADKAGLRVDDVLDGPLDPALDGSSSGPPDSTIVVRINRNGVVQSREV